MNQDEDRANGMDPSSPGPSIRTELDRYDQRN